MIIKKKSGRPVEEIKEEQVQKEPEVKVEEEKIDLFNLDNIDFKQRQERRRGDRRRGFRRIDDRNLISRAREEAQNIKEAAAKIPVIKRKTAPIPLPGNVIERLFSSISPPAADS